MNGRTGEATSTYGKAAMGSEAEDRFVSRTLWARGAKRAVELVLTSIGTMLISPVLIGSMVVVKLSSPGPVFFMQTRTGRCGRSFRPFKLRTMEGGRKPDPNEIIAADHPGVTRAGRMLRRLKLDELPQVLNVVLGDMSLVGPRPTLPEQTREYDAFKRRRLLVRPGLTGLAQVNGNTSISWEERIKYDVYYVKHHGLLMDLGILVRTVLVLLLGEERLAHPFSESKYAGKCADEDRVDG